MFPYPYLYPFVLETCINKDNEYLTTTCGALEDNEIDDGLQYLDDNLVSKLIRFGRMV